MNTIKCINVFRNSWGQPWHHVLRVCFCWTECATYMNRYFSVYMLGFFPCVFYYCGIPVQTLFRLCTETPSLWKSIDGTFTTTCISTLPNGSFFVISRVSTQHVLCGYLIPSSPQGATQLLLPRRDSSSRSGYTPGPTDPCSRVRLLQATHVTCSLFLESPENLSGPKSHL